MTRLSLHLSSYLPLPLPSRMTLQPTSQWTIFNLSMTKKPPKKSSTAQAVSTILPLTVLEPKAFTSVGLNYDHPLSKFGFAINVDVNAVICISCSKGVPIDMIRTHCRRYHNGREAPSLSQQKEITEADLNRRLRSSTADKYTQPLHQKPVDGLEVLRGYMCPIPNADGTICSKAFVAHSTFTRHLSSHPVYPKPDPSSCASSIQTLFAQGGLQMYFPVDVFLSQQDPPPNSAYADALHLVQTLPTPNIPVPDNDKERASVHWFTRWPELLESYCTDDAATDELRSLVSFPQSGLDPDWLVRVQDHGCKWWVKAESAHANCSHRASVLLKSHQEYVLALLPLLSPLTPRLRYCGAWKMLREPDSSRRYCGTAISFVSFCLRAVELPTEKSPTRFTDTQKHLLADYRIYLASLSTPLAEDIKMFQRVLTSVLFRDKSLQIDLLGKLACPVQSFMALLSIRSLGQFAKAGLVTQPISRLLYISRCSTLLFALDEASGADNRRFIRQGPNFDLLSPSNLHIFPQHP
jgi:hypothetical protein